MKTRVFRLIALAAIVLALLVVPTQTMAGTGCEETTFGGGECFNQSNPSDVDLAESLSVGATPTFMVGIAGADGLVKVETVIRGTQSVAEFAGTLDAVLADADSGV